MPRALLVLLLALAVLSPRRLLAEPIPLSATHPKSYYYLHGGVALGSLLATGTLEVAFAHHGAGYDLASFGPDEAVRKNFSGSAAQLSDKLVALTVVAPLLLQMSGGFDTSMGNASLIYSETFGLNLLLNDAVKLIVRRPRPYTHSRDPRIVEFADRQGADAYASFYSAHASTTHAAAMSGSILYAARSDELWARHTVWGLEFLMAGMTAQLRVRAGRHYRTDIWVGTLLGLGMGLAVPAAHGVDLGRIRGSEIATAAGALTLTMLLSEAVDFCSLLDTLHLCGLPRDIGVPLKDAQNRAPRWSLVPGAVGSGAGLVALGQL